MVKKNKFYLLGLLICIFAVNSARSQYYSTGFGGRIGSYTGIEIKHFLNDISAIEGMVSFPWNDIVLIHALYEFQNPVKGVEYFSWYIGGGGHIGWVSGNTIIGLDFIIGVEYTFAEAPFCIGLDWKPEINFVGDRNAWGDKVALSLKYVLR